ncbi:hypothetical protein [Cypionkella sinensis]|uniref:Uncharacterized protein n=1 Tax=Cypionkella sinensis TaxID=1756043 RepID=A0ABV7IVG6_9RHOB
MSVRAWMLMGVLGLIGFAALGQENKQPMPGNEESGSQTDGSQDRPPYFRLPVVIFDTDEQAQASRDEQEKAQQHDASDLVAQQSVADSTKIIVYYTKLQFVLALIGALALIISLELNRRATSAAIVSAKAARQAIDQEQANAQRALRAYVTLGKAQISGVDVGTVPRFDLDLVNTGQTPAKKFWVRYRVYLTPTDPFNTAVTEMRNSNPKGDLGADRTCSISCPLKSEITEEIMIAINSGKGFLWICGIYGYFDVFGVQRRGVFKLVATPNGSNGFGLSVGPNNNRTS